MDVPEGAPEKLPSVSLGSSAWRPGATALCPLPALFSPPLPPEHRTLQALRLLRAEGLMFCNFLPLKQDTQRSYPGSRMVC